jgi:uncharacterized DUF497 family protein
MAIYFEWDEAKAAKNLREHDVSFTAAMLVFADVFQVVTEDSIVDGEQRWRSIGLADSTTLLLVIYLEGTWDDDLYVRIISARQATPLESEEYDQNRAQDAG